MTRGRGRLGLVGLLAGAVLLANACHRQAPAESARPAPSAVTEPMASATPSAAPEPVAPKPWRQVYARACRGSITAPVVSPSGRTLAYCSAGFALSSGQYLGPVGIGYLALLDDSRALSETFDDEGIALVQKPASADSTGVIARSGKGDASSARVKRDGSQSVDIENLDFGSAEGKWSLVLRALPSLKELHRWKLEHHEGSDSAGFLASGEPFVVASSGCRSSRCGKDCERNTCNSRSLFRAGPDGLVPLVEHVKRAVVSEDGSLAVIAFADGERRVVALPGLDPIVDLPAAGNDNDSYLDNGSPLAIDAKGEHVAWVDNGVHLARIDRGKLVLLKTDPVDGPCELAFAAGRYLLAACDGEVHVLRQGAKRRTPPGHMAFAAPKGYRSSRIRGDEQTFSNFADESEGVLPSQVARLRDDKNGFEVWVYVHDAHELDRAGTLDDWAKLAIARFEGSGAERVRSWGQPGSRSLEYLVEVRDGCEPEDRYVRLTERGSILYQVVLAVPPGTPPARVKPALQVLFDKPFGAPATARKLARTAPPPRTPC